MEHRNSKSILKVTLPSGLMDKLASHAEERQLSKSEVIRVLIERAVTGESAGQRALENSMTFVHIAADAVLKTMCPEGVRDEVHAAHRALRNGNRSTGRQPLTTGT